MAVLVFSVLTAVLGVSARFVSLPYDSLGPGTARAVNSVVSVKGHPSYPPRGQLLYTTVSVRERVNPYEALAGWLDPDVDVIPEQKVRGDIPADVFRQQNVEAMADSKTTAELLALRHLGYPDLGDGAEIVSVDADPARRPAPAARDVIVEVDGQPVSTSDEAGDGHPGPQARRRRPPAPWSAEGSPPLDLEAPLGEGEGGRALLGVRLTTKVKLPFEITIDSGKVTGPSAGLAYALELLDVLTPGELDRRGPGGGHRRPPGRRHRRAHRRRRPEGRHRPPGGGQGVPRPQRERGRGDGPRRREARRAGGRVVRRRPPDPGLAGREQRPGPRPTRRRNVGSAPPSVT